MLGKAKHGVYKDDCDGIHPDTIAKYYGAEGHLHRLPGETGAGNPPDERVDDLTDQLHDHQNRNVKHDAVKVPRHANPFITNPKAEKLFISVLDQVVSNNVMPAGYGILPQELDGDYPDTEELVLTGRRKSITLSLAAPIWKQRAIFWVQALNVLSQFNFQSM